MKNIVNIPDPHAIVNCIFMASKQPVFPATDAPFFTENNWYVLEGNASAWYSYGHAEEILQLALLIGILHNPPLGWQNKSFVYPHVLIIVGLALSYTNEIVPLVELS